MITRALAIGLVVMLALAMPAAAQTWTPLVNQPTFNSSTALLLTDGTVMVQATESGIWWKLTPDNTGSYINGTWSQLASMPAGYGPLYYASAVLPDGRVVVEGGEYNNSGSGVWTTLGAIYDPAGNSWTSIAPPAGWTTIGDAQSVVLANGTFMLANCCNTQEALLNASTLTWTATGSGKTGENDEEGWTLLPNQKVLTVDANNPGNLTNSEIYNPATGSWTSAGSTIVKLPDTNSDNSGSHELGPAVLRPDGTVFATGGTSNTAIYNAASGAWSAGPTFPSGIDVADGPAAVLPNGNVLVDASPGVFNAPSQFFEFNGTSLISVPAAAGASSVPSYIGRMLVLPTGQILLTGLSSVQVYTASGTYQSAWQPAVTSVAANLSVGSLNNIISGTQFNGLSQGAAYGDDAQSATNYPLVRITNNATGHVFYARTHNHSTMAVATGSATVSTKFDVPAGIETGASTLQVVANGIPSSGVPVQIIVGQVQLTLVTPLALAPASPGVNQSTTATFTVQNTGSQAVSVQYFLAGARDPSNNNVDFPASTPVTLQPGQQYSYSAARSFATSGTYTTWPAYYDGQNWIELAPTHTTFTVQGTTPLFYDSFNRTTGLGSNWAVSDGSYTTDGNFAVGGTMTSSGSGNWAKLTAALPNSNYSVAADITVPSGSFDSGLVARSNDSVNFSRTLYAAQIATDGNINLYRRNDWNWTLLASTAGGIVANTSYNLNLIVTGSNPVHLEVWLNGAQKIVFSDNSTSQIATGAPGMENYDTGVKYDNFTIRQQ